MASVKVKSGWSQMAKRIAEISKLAGPGFLQECASRLADITMSKTARQMLMKQAPSGHRWKPFKKGGGAGFISALMASTHATKGASGFEVKTETPWAGYHQAGAKRAFASKATNNLLKDLLKKKDKSAIKSLMASAKQGLDPSLKKAKWKLPARRILPKRAIPKNWEDSYMQALERVFARYMQNGNA